MIRHDRFMTYLITVTDVLIPTSWNQNSLPYIYILFYKTKYKLIVSNTCDFYILIFENRTWLFSFIECSILCTPLRTYLLSYKTLPISAFWILHKLILSHTWRKMTTRKEKCFRCVKLSVKIWFPRHRYNSDLSYQYRFLSVEISKNWIMHKCFILLHYVNRHRSHLFQHTTASYTKPIYSYAIFVVEINR